MSAGNRNKPFAVVVRVDSNISNTAGSESWSDASPFQSGVSAGFKFTFFPGFFLVFILLLLGFSTEGNQQDQTQEEK